MRIAKTWYIKNSIQKDIPLKKKGSSYLLSIYTSWIRGLKWKYRVTTFAYEIRCAPTKAYMLKNLLCKISSEDPHFKFIPNGLNTITTPTTMRQIILKQNTFLSDMAIVPINWILQKDKLQVMESLKKSTNFTAMEPTRNSSEGRWILVTTT